jgi:hypothetical protein
MPATAHKTPQTIDTALRAPQPLALPIKRGKMARIPERWTGPLSGAPFEAQVDSDGSLSLGVAFICPKGQRRTGSLWLACADGPELVDRSMAIDAALATALGRQTPDAKGRVGKIGLGQLLETLLWVEQGAGVHGAGPHGVNGAGQPVALRPEAATLASGAVRTSGARSLFADVAKSLKKTLATFMANAGHGGLAGVDDRQTSAACN